MVLDTTRDFNNKMEKNKLFNSKNAFIDLEKHSLHLLVSIFVVEYKKEASMSHSFKNQMKKFDALQNIYAIASWSEHIAVK